MKNFLRRTLLFLLPIFGYIIFSLFFLEHFLALKNGPNTKNQIRLTFENALKRDYDVLVLGNSRAYRGINPDRFSLKTFNFSHDNDSYNQLYHKIMFLDRNNKKFKYLILGVDYFQFNIKSNSRNYAYADFLGHDYLNDYTDKVWKLKLDYYLENLDIKKLKYLRGANEVPFQRENGQYIKPGTAKETDTITRNISRSNLQVDYFEKIINYCKKKSIPVYLVMLPIRTNELKSYSTKQIAEFKDFLNKYINKTDVFYFDFSLRPDFTLKDYTDITHLNSEAADRFSKLLSDTISIVK